MICGVEHVLLSTDRVQADNFITYDSLQPLFAFFFQRHRVWPAFANSGTIIFIKKHLVLLLCLSIEVCTKASFHGL